MLFLLVLLPACGDGRNRNTIFASSFQTNRGFQRSFSAVSLNNVRYSEQLRDHLVGKAWVGLDSKMKPVGDTAIQFYDPRFNPDLGQYRFQFNLLYRGEALRGETREGRTTDGSIQGVIQHNDTRAFKPICFSWGRSNYSRPTCFSDSSLDLEGGQINFRIVNSDIGPAIELSFYEYPESRTPPNLLRFQEQSVVDARLSTPPPKPASDQK